MSAFGSLLRLETQMELMKFGSKLYSLLHVAKFLRFQPMCASSALSLIHSSFASSSLTLDRISFPFHTQSSLMPTSLITLPHHIYPARQCSARHPPCLLLPRTSLLNNLLHSPINPLAKATAPFLSDVWLFLPLDYHGQFGRQSNGL